MSLLDITRPIKGTETARTEPKGMGRPVTHDGTDPRREGGVKKCKKCGEVKPHFDYPLRKIKGVLYIHCYCKQCLRDESREYRLKRSEAEKDIRLRARIQRKIDRLKSEIYSRIEQLNELDPGHFLGELK